jgi:hypothetical protein
MIVWIVIANGEVIAVYDNSDSAYEHSEKLSERGKFTKVVEMMVWTF